MHPVLREILEIGAVLFWSSLKYMIGLAHSTLIFNQGFLISVGLTISGGMMGVFVFAFFDKAIRRLWHRFRGDSDIIKKIKFSRNKRRLVKFRNKFGLAGIAILTPILLQVPFGTIMAMRLTHNVKKISLYMLGSFLLYSLAFCGLYYGFYEDFKPFFDRILHSIKG